MFEPPVGPSDLLVTGIPSCINPLMGVLPLVVSLHWAFNNLDRYLGVGTTVRRSNVDHLFVVDRWGITVRGDDSGHDGARYIRLHLCCSFADVQQS